MRIATGSLCKSFGWMQASFLSNMVLHVKENKNNNNKTKQYYGTCIFQQKIFHSAINHLIFLMFSDVQLITATQNTDQAQTHKQANKQTNKQTNKQNNK